MLLRGVGIRVGGEGRGEGEALGSLHEPFGEVKRTRKELSKSTNNNRT